MTEISQETKIVTRTEFLDKAKGISKDRADKYGKPENNFQDMADHMTIHIRKKLKPGEVITSEDATLFMVYLKAARIATGEYTEDNYVDGANYFGCGGEVRQVADSVL